MAKMDNAARKNRDIQLIFCLCCVLAFVSSCGRKRPPLPPTMTRPAAVTDLKLAITGDLVKLQWTIPKTGQGIRLEEFVIYRATRKLDGEECRGCPLVFENAGRTGEMDFKYLGRGKMGANFSEKIDRKGFKYIYKVVGISDEGWRSKGSNLVQVDYK